MSRIRREPVWLDMTDLIAIHDGQIARHGGGTGLRDRNMLDSALARPRNNWAYGETDPATLAAAYAFGITRNHAFVDGNKRSAWVAARLFLNLNGVALAFSEEDAIAAMLALAAGDLTEDELADWFRQRIVAG